MTTKWTWAAATGADISDISRQCQQLFDYENPQANAQKIFKPDALVYNHKITLAIVNQFYNPGLELVYVARQQLTGQLLAHTWAARGETPLWSADEMCAVKMAHVDYELPTKTKLSLIREMMDIWEVWCRAYNIDVIHSSTMRLNTSTFLKMHQRCGYAVRGSSAYKRLST